jgi:sigma-B regulation protein RsbU (phosphoserine phosphatase)
VSEASNTQSELFEESRLRVIIENFNGETVEQLGDAIREGMRAFTEGAAQSDDITILVIEYKGNLA